MSQTYYNIKSEKVDYFNSQLIKVLNKKIFNFLILRIIVVMKF